MTPGAGKGEAGSGRAFWGEGPPDLSGWGIWGSGLCGPMGGSALGAVVPAGDLVPPPLLSGLEKKRLQGFQLQGFFKMPRSSVAPPAGSGPIVSAFLERMVSLMC